jgi:phenylalanyl-tRNA synthetase beta chain
VPAAGGLVVLAPLGAHLPAKGMTIERRAIGGVTSEGMLCSESELGLSEDSEGILILPPGTGKPGDRFVDVVPAARDTVLEIGLTPNRPDGLGHIGLAREIAALFGITWAPPAPRAPSAVAPGASVNTLVKITVEDGERCPHFGAQAVVDVTIGPSPLWLRYRLAALGVRSISNVVDITNLVMLEYGHPMHAFDLDRVRGGTIVVRHAREGEHLRTLDGVDRALVADDVIIADAEGATGLGGVMGGEISEIGPTTKRVLFECAYFDARGVRRVSRRHGLHTDASHRFERGVDPSDIAEVLAQAGALATELAGARAVPGAIHVVSRPPTQVSVTLRASRIARIIGVDVPWEAAIAVLQRLGCKLLSRAPASEGGPSATFQIPTHRPDITREVDLIEEVARVHGFDKIPAELPAIRPTREETTRESVLARGRAVAIGLGLMEAVTYGYSDEASLAKFGAPAPVVRLKNPLNENQAVMRTNLVPSLLACADRAARRGERDLRFFTVGPVFLGGTPGSPLPEERVSFAAVLTGERPTWLAKAPPVDVWDAKGLGEAMVERVTGRAATVRAYAAGRPTYLHPRGAAELVLEGEVVGRFGLLHPDVRDALGLEVTGDIAVAEVDLDALERRGRGAAKYKPLPRFPASVRDMAVVVRTDVPAGEVESAVRATAGELAEEVRLFDRFLGAPVPDGHANLAFRIVYRRPDRTLTDAEVDAQHAKVESEVKTRFGATLRA